MGTRRTQDLAALRMGNARRLWLERLEARWELPPRWGLGTNPLGAHSRLEKKKRRCKLQVRKGGCLPLDRSPGGSDPPLSVLLRTPLRSEIVQNTSRPGCLIDAESRSPWIRATDTGPSRAS
ncbi:hypothetical protein VTN02DRAFT_3233 [Thermoascus thermophilus]